MTARHWFLSHCAHDAARRLADRHYNRQKPGTNVFVQPGRTIVLLTQDEGALWVTSWQFRQWVKHDWPTAWVNSYFRRESGTLASELIREAVAITRHYWMPPPDGIITFVDPAQVRHKRDPGRCYLRAGFHFRGHSKNGLLCFGMDVADMPEAMAPAGDLNGQLLLTGCADLVSWRKWRRTVPREGEVVKR